MEAQSEQVYKLVAIDNNNNVTHAVNTRNNIINLLVLINSDEAENSYKNIKRVVDYNIYRVTKNFMHSPCPCMIPYIKRHGERIEQGGIKITLNPHGCSHGQHKWIQVEKDDKYEKQICIYCRCLKNIIHFDDCPTCHKEIQPIINLIG